MVSLQNRKIFLNYLILSKKKQENWNNPEGRRGRQVFFLEKWGIIILTFIKVKDTHGFFYKVEEISLRFSIKYKKPHYPSKWVSGLLFFFKTESSKLSFNNKQKKSCSLIILYVLLYKAQEILSFYTKLFPSIKHIEPLSFHIFS